MVATLKITKLKTGSRAMSLLTKLLLFSNPLTMANFELFCSEINYGVGSKTVIIDLVLWCKMNYVFVLKLLK